MKNSGKHEIFQGSLHLHLKNYQQLEHMSDRVYKSTTSKCSFTLKKAYMIQAFNKNKCTGVLKLEQLSNCVCSEEMQDKRFEYKEILLAANIDVSV